jgi:hypothetical protein
MRKPCQFFAQLFVNANQQLTTIAPGIYGCGWGICPIAAGQIPQWNAITLPVGEGLKKYPYKSMT